MGKKFKFIFVALLLVEFMGSCVFANKGGLMTENKIYDFDGSTSSLDKFLGSTINIYGIASNAKLSAVVKTKNYHFYIDGLDAWPKDLYGANIVVTGVLTKIKNDTVLKSKDGITSQGIQGNYFILKKATWRLVKKDDKVTDSPMDKK